MIRLAHEWTTHFFSAVGRAAILLALVAATGGRASAEEISDPRSLGPYPVGVTTVVFVDSSRTDAASDGPRSLLTEIWYPATEESRDLPKNKATDFLLGGAVPALYPAFFMAFRARIDEFDAKFQNDAVRDARVREGRFPLVIFSHGNGGMRNQSTFWCDHLASHGYVVVSADHTGNSAYTAVDGKLVPYNGAGRMASAEDRPKDVSFLIDRMTAFDKGADSRFNGRIDVEKIGVAGHSFGGLTAIHVINTDDRVKAIIPMTPVWRERTNYSTPVLMILASEDKTIGATGNAHGRQYVDESKGPRYLVEILDGGHYSPTDMFQINPEFGDGVGKGERITRPGEAVTYLAMDLTYEIINSYSVAFFGVYLKGEADYLAYLEANHYGEKIVHKHARPEEPS